MGTINNYFGIKKVARTERFGIFMLLKWLFPDVTPCSLVGG